VRSGAAGPVLLAALVSGAGAAVARAEASAGAEEAEPAPDPRARRAAAEANLEPVRRREGLAIGVSLGTSVQVGVGIAEASGTGGAFGLRVGTSAHERLAWFVDLATAGLPARRDDEKLRINQTTALTAGAQLFVLESLWVRGGAGLGQLELRSEVSGSGKRVRHAGLGLLAGGGIDILRRGRFALSGDLTFVSGVFAGGWVTAAVFSLGFTWY
jgi:hypothetical protein